MIAPNSNSLCGQARQYYYDFFGREDHGDTPEPIIKHIEQCENCQEQINTLKEALSQARSGVIPQRMQVNSAVTTMLELHFAYINRRVTCQSVRPFLPGLLDPALEIRIPTPITAHLDNCQQCSEDLEIIRGLNLTRSQLHRLSQLFADQSSADTKLCSKAQDAVASVVAMAFGEINAEVLKHVCICPDCRALVYQRREMARKGLQQGEAIRDDFPCEKVRASDIFDYCFPYGIDPASDQYAKFRNSLTSHICICSDCLGKMQQLHKTIYKIIERAESGTFTVYDIDESAKKKAVSESDDIYAGFPIKVEVAGQQAPGVDFAVVPKQKVSKINFRPLLKTAAVTAAVLLIGVGLLLNIPTAKAVTLEQIYKAIENVRNVYISVFRNEKLIQEIWISRTLNVYMTKTGENFVLWDVANQLRKDKNSDTGTFQTTSLVKASLASIEKKMSGSLGMLPFYDISGIPANAEWNRAGDGIVETTADDTQVYDLIWVRKSHAGPDIFNKWRIFVDTETNLPQKTELYRKSTTDDEYILESVKVVEYLSDSEMQVVIKDASF